MQSADWLGAEGVKRFERAPDSRAPLPLPEGVDCFTVAASTSDKLGDFKDWLLGDGLVPVRSALGQHDEPQHCLAFAEDHQLVLAGTNHMELLTRPEVTARLVQWLGH